MRLYFIMSCANILCKIKIFTKDIQLRWLQYRIIYRIFATNSQLFKLKIVKTELCAFCNTDVENLTHFLLECIYVDEI